jgi:hypothetical protein
MPAPIGIKSVRAISTPTARPTSSGRTLPAVWLMNGTSLISGANVGFDPGSNWHVIPHHDVLV